MRRALTMLELIVVIVVLAIIAGLLFVSRPTIRGPARIQTTNNNLRRIVEAQIGYSSDAGTWAYLSGVPVPDGSDPVASMEYIGRTFVLLARSNELSAKLFTNPSNPIKPSPELPFMVLSYGEIVSGSNDPATTPDPLSQVEAHRWSASFAYDYCAPQNSQTGRPIIGDRDPSIWGGKGACVAYGDGHATFVQAYAVDEPSFPCPETGTVDDDLAVRIQSEWNVKSTEESVDDWIYNHDTHLGERYPGRVGRGSSTLAWLR